MILISILDSATAIPQELVLNDDTCTPGNVSWVHFTYKDGMERMKNKKPQHFTHGSDHAEQFLLRVSVCAGVIIH